MNTDQPQVEVRRSARRRRTLSAYRDGDRIVVLAPGTLSARDEERLVPDLVARLLAKEARRRAPAGDDALMRRAHELADRFLPEVQRRPSSVRWVSNQNRRWGSCTPSDASIRLSHRLRDAPPYVVDYVLVHELAHLAELHHTARFWAIVGGYPDAERAKGFLDGWSHALRTTTPGEPTDEDDTDL